MCWDAKVCFGKHEGKALVRVLLDEPSYVAWALAQSRESQEMDEFQGTVDLLLTYFDSCPFQVPCQGGCSSEPTHATLYRDSASLMYWCNECDSCSMGAERYKLHRVWKYTDLLEYVEGSALQRQAVRAFVSSKLPRPFNPRAQLTLTRLKPLFSYAGDPAGGIPCAKERIPWAT